MELVEEVKELLQETEVALKGSARRLFMARTVHASRILLPIIANTIPLNAVGGFSNSTEMGPCSIP